MTIDQVTDYAESTSSTMLYALLSMFGLSASENLSHAASHVGVATSLATLLRALPYHASQRRMIIPAEITSKNGVREEDVFSLGGSADSISDAVYDFATVANDHLLTARDMFKEGGVPREAMPIFLHAVCKFRCFVYSDLLLTLAPLSCVDPNCDVPRATGESQLRRVRPSITDS